MATKKGNDAVGEHIRKLLATSRTDPQSPRNDGTLLYLAVQNKALEWGFKMVDLKEMAKEINNAHLKPATILRRRNGILNEATSADQCRSPEVVSRAGTMAECLLVRNEDGVDATIKKSCLGKINRANKARKIWAAGRRALECHVCGSELRTTSSVCVKCTNPKCEGSKGFKVKL